MDARLWHQQATAPSIALPSPVPVEVFDELPDAAQDAYWELLSSGLATVVLPSVLARRAATRLTRLVERNTLRPPGAKAIGSVSAPFAVGKSTFVKDWAQAAYRDLLGPACADPRPTWNPEPGVTADWIPHVYITLRAASRIRDVLAALLLTMGYPSEGLVRVTTTRVVHAFRQHGVRLLLIDDAHFLDVSNKDSRDMLDFLKYLNTELGELGGTMILIGADLHDSPIYLDPQINSRLERVTLHPYGFGTEEEKRDWQRFLKDAEAVLLPYFDCAPAGVFARDLAGHIWRRTQGYVGDTALLLTEALLAAFDDGSETITTDHLDAVPLSARATAGEVDLRTATPKASKRRAKVGAS
jgi:hypothetical protein